MIIYVNMNVSSICISRQLIITIDKNSKLPLVKKLLHKIGMLRSIDAKGDVYNIHISFDSKIKTTFLPSCINTTCL